MGGNDELKWAISHFKNGDFNKSHFILSSIDQSGLKKQNRLIYHEFMAASLERLQRLDEAILQARHMITADHTYPKGYLRMGKILRLLGDLKGAITAYEMGLRRAKSGLDLIRSQLSSVLKEFDGNRKPCYDPFELLPIGVGIKIFNSIEMTNRRNVSVMSQFSAVCGNLALSRYGMIEIANDKSSSKALNLIISRPSCQRLICSGPAFEGISEKCVKLANALHTSIVTIKRLNTCYMIPEFYDSFKKFNGIRSLRLEDFTISSGYFNKLIICLGNLKHLKLKNGSIADNEIEAMIFRDLSSLSIDSLTGIGPETIVDLVRAARGLKCLHWYHPIGPSLLAETCPELLKDLTNIGLHSSYLEQNLCLRFVRSLKLVSDHFYTVPNTCLLNLTCMENLSRLHLKGLILSREHTLQGNIFFPKLEHLLVDSVFPCPTIKSWIMPKLKSVVFNCTEITNLNQVAIDFVGTEVLIRKKSLFMNLGCFKLLLELFTLGKINVLGISDAQQFYKTDGFSKLQAIATSQPCSLLLLSNVHIEQRILRIWPDLTFD